MAIAIAASFALDAPLATLLHRTGIDESVKHFGTIIHLIKSAGHIAFTLLIALALCIFDPRTWRAALFEMACGLAASVNFLIKWLVGRTRPFKLPPTTLAQPFRFSPCNGGWYGLFHPSADLSFVSGHVTLAVATAAGLWWLFPRQRLIPWIAGGIAMVVALERVIENAHWLSDTTCAAGVGIAVVAALARIPLDRRHLCFD